MRTADARIDENWRRGGRRGLSRGGRGRWALGLLLAGILSLAVVASAHAAPEQTVLYTGEMTFSVNDHAEIQGGWTSSEKWSYSWAMSESGELSSGPLVPWTISSFTGSWKHEGKENEGTGHPQSFSCGGPVVLAEQEPEISNPVPLVEETSPYWRTGSGSKVQDGWIVQVIAPGAIEKGAECGMGSATSGKENIIDRWLLGTYRLQFPLEGAYTLPIEEKLDCTIGAPECVANGGEGGTLDTSIHAQLTFSSGGVAPPTQVGPTPPPKSPPPPKDPYKERLHEQARIDLRRAILRMGIACGVEVGHGISEALEVVASPTEVGELAMAGLQPLVNAAINGTLNSLGLSPTAACDKAAEAVKEAHERYINDPPDPAYHQVALPIAQASKHAGKARKAGGGHGKSKKQTKSKSKAGKSSLCADARGKQAANCERLVSAATALGKAGNATAAVEGALTTTSNRLATATQAGDATGVALQEATSNALMGELASDLQAQNKAQATLMADLAKYKIKITVKPKTAEQGIAEVLKQTAAQGIASAELQSLAGDELTPQGISFSSLLGTPTPTTVAEGLWHAMTLPGVAAILGSLEQAGTIPAAQRATLTADLTAVEGAPAGAANEAALEKFVKAAEALHGEAGSLLAYAARPLI